MSKVKQVRLSGFGGQGVVLAGTILSYAAIRDGRWVAGSSAYGAQARGGTARYDVLIADDPIKFPHMISTDILIAFSQKAYEEALTLLTGQGAVVIYDSLLVKPQALPHANQIGIPATDQALQELKNKQTANMVMLGAAAAVTGLASHSSLQTALEENSAERFKDINLQALAAGFRLGQELGMGKNKPGDPGTNK